VTATIKKEKIPLNRDTLFQFLSRPTQFNINKTNPIPKVTKTQINTPISRDFYDDT